MTKRPDRAPCVALPLPPGPGEGNRLCQPSGKIAFPQSSRKHRASNQGDFIAMHLFEDLIAINRSAKLINAIETGRLVLNVANRLQGVEARRGGAILAPDTKQTWQLLSSTDHHHERVPQHILPQRRARPDARTNLRRREIARAGRAEGSRKS